MLTKLVIFTLCAANCFAKFPSDIPRCKAGDLQCIVEVSNEVVSKYPEGRPDLGLPAYDPYVIQNFNLSEYESVGAPVNFNLFLKTAKIYGLSQSNFLKAVGWERNPNNSKHELYGTIPKLEIKGQYRADGKILFLPIRGEGDFEVILDKVLSGLKFKSYTVEKNGLNYLQLQKVKVFFEPSKMSGRLTNLFDGNKEVEDSINDILNKNWKVFWDEVSPGVLKIAEMIIKDTLQKFFDNYEFDDFYLP